MPMQINARVLYLQYKIKEEQKDVHFTRDLKCLKTLNSQGLLPRCRFPCVCLFASLRIQHANSKIYT